MFEGGRGTGGEFNGVFFLFFSSSYHTLFGVKVLMCFVVTDSLDLPYSFTNTF